MISRTFPRRALAAALLLIAAACSADSVTGTDGGGSTNRSTNGSTNGGSNAGNGGSSGSRAPSNIPGNWAYGSLSMTDYYNASTGAHIGNGYGTSVLFSFTADGKYTQTIYISSTVYSCRTDVFIYNEGTVKWETTQFRVYPTKGRVRSSDTCNARFNFDRDDDIKSKQGDLYSWAFEKNASDGKTYLMIGVDGDMQNRSSFRPAN
jgi:hypothetical protein